MIGDVFTRIQQIQGRIGAIEARFGHAGGRFDQAMKAATAAPAEPGNLLAEAAHTGAVDPALVRAVMTAESGGDPKATSPVGAMGLMQLMPGTAKALGVEHPYDPRENLVGGAKYLGELTRRFGLEQGVAAYNAGPGAVEHYGGVPPYRETQAYVDKVLSLYQQFKSPGGGGLDTRR